MKRMTRRMRKYKKNRTFKRGGGDYQEYMNEDYQEQQYPEQTYDQEDSENSGNFDQTDDNQPTEERQGIIDIIRDGTLNLAMPVVRTVGDLGLGMIGLQRINKTPSEYDTMPSEMGTMADDMAGNAINDVNGVLGSEQVESSAIQAAKQTVNITKNIARQFNNTLDDPELKEELKQAFRNAAETGSIIMDASKKPLKKAADRIGETANRVIPKITTAATKGLMDSLMMTPAALIIEPLNMVNDMSKAASAAVEAGSNVIETSADLVNDTSKNLKELNEQKMMAEDIENRTSQSINEFENPLENSNQDTMGQQMVGGRRTRKRQIKRRYKTKRRY